VISLAPGVMKRMTTIPIEAQVSTDQLLHAVEQVPPREFAAFLGRLLELQALRSQRHRDIPAAEIQQHLVDLAAQVQATRQRVLGLNAGALITTDDFDAPLSDDFWLGRE
jgi:hypothetical protein